MNKKVVMLVVLLAAAGVLMARAIFFTGPPPGYKTPETAAPAAASPAEGAPKADAAAPNATAGAAAAPANAAPEAPVDLDALTAGVQVVEFQYDPAKLARNPMTPLVGPQAVIAAANAATGVAGDAGAATGVDILAQQLAVTGIIWDKKFPVAVINDDVVAQGDTLAEGIVVKTIEPDKVILAVRDQSVSLPLKRLEEQ